MGGPAIVFKRYHGPDQMIRDTQKPCKAILGYDANALYLKCTGERMPAGIPYEFTPVDGTGDEVRFITSRFIYYTIFIRTYAGATTFDIKRLH